MDEGSAASNHIGGVHHGRVDGGTAKPGGGEEDDDEEFTAFDKDSGVKEVGTALLAISKFLLERERAKRRIGEVCAGSLFCAGSCCQWL